MDMEDQKRQAAKDFAEYWKDKGYEKGESQKFWLSLLRDVYGVSHPERYISFEDQVHLDHTSFIDGMIPSTHVMIEQKGRNKNLKAAIKQSDGSLLNPFQQAKRYITELPVSMHPQIRDYLQLPGVPDLQHGQPPGRTGTAPAEEPAQGILPFEFPGQ